ncbi:MAG: hypothetical protein IJ877_00275 [Candidatus Gastranaerophilales bacterium]|nr:hypothetical protein [Candidatus Gastranaerophilales bacterium]
MSFLRQFAKSEIVFIINDKIIKDSLVKKIISNIKPGYKIGLDMKNVKSLNSALFLKCLNNNVFKLYNLNSELLTYLSIVIKDGKLKSYMDFQDFKENKRELIRRRFLIA